MKRLKSFVFSFFALVFGFSLFFGMSSGQIIALDGSDFQAGNIISDSNFFNGGALSAAEVQQFLESKVPTCDTDGSEPYGGTTRAQYGTSQGYPPPYTCLKSYKQNVLARSPEDQLCNGISAASNRTAAQIIDLVARSCGVSPKVLLVLLQKEQSLVTDEWPWSIQYRSATGYGCPDTAPCDSEYYGFFNQIYHAARIYKYYAKYPDSFNHIAGATNFVRYNPTASCGGSNVFIQNQATAGLYNYTPYQPNGAALNNLYGTGNSCSAYGNRNFWRMYNDWFGNTLTEPYTLVTLVGDWDGDGDDNIGLKRGNEFFLDTNNNGISNISFGIGKTTDTTIVGDWDGDGDDNIGLRRGNYYYLDYNNDNLGDVTIGYGKVTDKVIVGDWDGDGDDNIGLKRGNEFFLDTNNNGISNISFGIGKTTDTTIVGDWDGDGDDNIGLRRGNYYYLDYNNDNLGDVTIGYGKVTDKVIVGDWDGDGDDNIGLRRGNYYRFDDNNDGASDTHFGIGKESDSVVIGDWDDDGKDEMGLKRYNRYYYDNDLDGNADISFLMNYY